MCGIAGIIDGSKKISHLEKSISLMLDPIKHRGPDHQGYWLSEKKDIAIGNTRLSIQDLSNKETSHFSHQQKIILL